MTLPTIAACLPVDTSDLPPLPPDVRLPVPLQDDTLRRCQRCGREVWVGPRKLALADRGVAVIMCYLCALTALAEAGVLPGSVAVVDIDPNRIERPRET